MQALGKPAPHQPKANQSKTAVSLLSVVTGILKRSLLVLGCSFAFVGDASFTVSFARTWPFLGGATAFESVE